jgi:dihydrofolate reductase
MGIVTVDVVMSLDGFIAGPNVRVEDNPAGDGGVRLHEWIAGLASWRERQGLEGGATNADSALVGEWFDATGAVVMGRVMFDTGEEPWGDVPPFRAPVFVVTHRPRPFLPREGGTSFTFVPEGVAHAVALAREAAGDRNVDVAGGADTIQQALAAGLVDELHLHVMPFLMGRGTRLFGDLDRHVDLERIHAVEGDGATHLRYRVLR